MSRKDYQAFADSIHSMLAESYSASGKPLYDAFTLERVAIEACRIFESDNPRFDRQRFMVAAGLRNKD